MPKAIRSLSARPYLLFVAALVTVTALLVGTTDSFSASSLKVISPNGGQSYAVGQSVNIKWAKGNGGSQVKVTLLKGGKGYLVIQKKTKNDGKLTWKVPSKVKAGSNYKIKIQSLSDTKVSDISNKPFKITKAKDTKAKDTKTATFKVTQPNGRKAYKTGKKMAIRWNKGTGTYVKITLLKGKTTTTIHKKTKNDGKHTYTIPSTIKAGKTYKVKICSTKSTKSCATSKAFTIAKGTATTIKVTYPNGAEELEQGGTHVIKWNKGNGGKFVKIQLTRVVKGKDKGFRYLAKKTKNTGKYSWKIPTTNKYPVGSKYKIKVMAFKGGNKINDLSDKTFSIVAASSGGSTGGGSTGGGNTGGGSTGGGNTGGGNKDDHDGDATVDEPTGPPETDDGADVESTFEVTSPDNGQVFVGGKQFTTSWKGTGILKDRKACVFYNLPPSPKFPNGIRTAHERSSGITEVVANDHPGEYSIVVSVRPLKPKKRCMEIDSCAKAEIVGACEKVSFTVKPAAAPQLDAEIVSVCSTVNPSCGFHNTFEGHKVNLGFKAINAHDQTIGWCAAVGYISADGDLIMNPNSQQFSFFPRPARFFRHGPRSEVINSIDIKLNGNVEQAHALLFILFNNPKPREDNLGCKDTFVKDEFSVEKRRRVELDVLRER